MPIKIQCAACAGALRAPDKARGHALPCPLCGQSITVPKNATSTVAKPASSATPRSVKPSTQAGPGGSDLQRELAPVEIAAPAETFSGDRNDAAIPNRGKRGFLSKTAGFAAVLLIASGVFGFAYWGNLESREWSPPGPPLSDVLYWNPGEVITYAPPASNFVLHINLADALQAPVIKELMESNAVRDFWATAATDGDLPWSDLLDLLQRDNFTSRVQSVTLAGDLTAPESFLVVVRFHQDSSLSDFLSPRQLAVSETSEINGTRVMGIESGHVCMPDAQTMLFAAAEDALSVPLHNGPVSSFERVAQNVFTKADYSGPVVMAVSLSPPVEDVVLSNYELWLLTQRLSGVVIEVQAWSEIDIKCLLTHEHDSFIHETVETIEVLQGAIGAEPLVAIMDGLPEALQNAVVATDRTDVIVEARIPTAAVIELMEFQQAFGIGINRDVDATNRDDEIQ